MCFNMMTVSNNHHILSQPIKACNRNDDYFNGDVSCDMNIKESEAFGKILDIELLFERDVKPMKKINEEHKFQLQEKKLDYDDKIGLAMNNIRYQIIITFYHNLLKVVIEMMSIYSFKKSAKSSYFL